MRSAAKQSDAVRRGRGEARRGDRETWRHGDAEKKILSLPEHLLLVVFLHNGLQIDSLRRIAPSPRHRIGWFK